MIEHYKQRSDYEMIFSPEEKPLGTAGAVKNAENKIKSDPFFVLNGDSFCRVNCAAFLDFHQKSGAQASLALVPVDSSKDYGSVQLDPGGKCITSFQEKTMDGSGYVNAGIYCLKKACLFRIPAGIKVSLENEVFPGLVGHGFCGYPVDGPLIDIGTPERYAFADEHTELFS